jgi:hypothetical protein
MCFKAPDVHPVVCTAAATVDAVMNGIKLHAVLLELEHV